MNTGDPDWDLYRTFLAVAAEGSLSGAARRLGLTQPTVGRHVEALEAQLQATLFTRSQRGLTLTETANQIKPLAEEMAATAAALRRASSSEAGDDGGCVRLTAPEMVGLEILPPILADFGFAHPGIELELSLSNHNLDLLQRDADVAVRMARPTQKALVARRIGVIEIGLYAHRRYVEVFGVPKTPAERARHRLIGFDQDPQALRSAGGLAARLTRDWFSFRTDSGAAQIAALRAGAGIGGLATLLAAREPDLVRVMADDFAFPREMWVVMHEDSRQVRRVKLLFDHLAEALGRAIAGQQAPLAAAS